MYLDDCMSFQTKFFDMCNWIRKYESVASAMEMDHFLPPIQDALQRYTQHIIFIEDW